jgi:predicted NBD/HSP70 family sugar kinase
MVDMNRNLVLNVLRTGAASRAEVVRASGLSPATVSLIVAELIDSGLVNEVGAGKSSGGRPPVLLRLDDERNYAVGVKLMGDAMALAVTDLRAEVLCSQLVPLERTGPSGRPRAASPETVVGQVSSAIEVVVEKAGIGLEKVVGIGVGLAGLVEAATGVCRYSPSFGWRDVAVAAPISAKLGRQVLVDNDVNTLTLAEQWFGRGHGVEDFLVVTIGEGVGVGIVVDGKLYRGSRGAAGELGHLRLADQGALCRCGGHGCLEALASDGAVRAYVAAALKQAERSSIKKSAVASLTMSAVREAAEGGDQVATAALERAGYMLGMGIAGLVNLFNPRLVIIAGEGTLAGPLRTGAALGAVRECSFAGLDADAEIVVDSTDDVAWARGAACIVLGELFSSPIRRSVQLDTNAHREPQAHVADARSGRALAGGGAGR